jgi:cysteinyl-tRNA synthetase
MTAEEWKSGKQRSLSFDAGEIEAMVANRNAARTARNFAEADRIRDELLAMGVVLQDSKSGTTWEVTR